METNRVINAVRNPQTNLAKLSALSGVSIRSLMDLRHNPMANPTLRTMEAIAKALPKMAMVP